MRPIELSNGNHLEDLRFLAQLPWLLHLGSIRHNFEEYGPGFAGAHPGGPAGGGGL